MATVDHSKFNERFDRIWAQARLVQLAQAVCWAILIGLGGIALLAAADYWLELPRTWRIGGMVITVVAALATAAHLAFESVRRWQRSATAAAIERFFPQLGQRIRTTLQYGEMSRDEIEAQGVAGGLVTALEDDTVALAKPLPLDAVIPWRSLALASLMAAVVGLVLAGLSAFDWQWRAAAGRALLGDQPYTEIIVEPGNATLKEGESITIDIVVAGRIGDEIHFEQRRADEEDASWRTETLLVSEAKQLDERRLQFSVPLDRLRHPREYRVSAASVASETYRVEVIYPLKIHKVEATVTSPEYTRLPVTTIAGGNIAALIGSKIDLEIELDREPETAWLELRDLTPQPPVEGQPDFEKIPLVIDGDKLTASLEVTGDKTFTVVARSADGMELADNKQRIRARKDEPPQVYFESPSEAVEVHTLAEVIMRIRVSDDFGLARAGIMFEVNNEEEYPLLAKDFQEAAEELEKTGTLSAKTRETLEKLLPLEHFALTQRDSVMYYAFAEDTRPSGMQRTETDLRFIDIRPFKREYRSPPEMDGEPGGEMMNRIELKSLEELISRQRYALNRALQLDRRFKHTQETDLAGTDGLIKFEGELAKNTRELAEGLEARGVDETELLYQAETAMLAATDSLSAGKYDTSTLQMRDALKALIEGRDRLRVDLMRRRNRQQLAQLRQFDRMQQQKLRRPKNQEEEAREVAERLEELAQRENMIGEQIVAGGKEGPAGDMTDANMSPMNQELQDKQLDVALEAREIEKVLSRLQKATDLAKERMAAAAKTTEDAAAAIGGGKLEEALKGTEDAEKQFLELAEQVRALLAEEQAERIAAAQQMAQQLAQQQQDFIDRLAKSEGSGGSGGKPMEDEAGEDEKKPMNMGGGKEGKEMTPEEKAAEKQALADAAAEIGEKAETLADVLGAAAKSDAPEDLPTAEKVEELIQSLGIGELKERLKGLGEQVANDKNEDARATAGDAAERLEAAAEQLGNLHRNIVAPQVMALADLERQLNALDEKLDQLNTDANVSGWHNDAAELLDKLDEAGVDPEDKNAFEEEMKKNGYGDRRNGGWNWTRTEGGNLQAPKAYRTHIARLSTVVREKMQELILGEHIASGDEPIPPQYEALVDKYYEVLAGEGTPGKKAESK